MSSTRNAFIRPIPARSGAAPAWLALALAIATLAVGCSTEQKYVSAPVNNAPIVGDEAMALRADWPKSVSTYANGDTRAYSTRFPYDVNANHNTGGETLLGPVMFVVQVALLPVELVVNPPFKEQYWHGEEVGPTYSAQPPLPPPGGAPVPRIGPSFPFLGAPQAAANADVGLPNAPATPASGANQTQLPSYFVGPPSPAATPAPPPGSPGSLTGPPVTH